MRRRLAMIVALVAAASCLPVGGPPPSLPLTLSAAVSSSHALVTSPWGIDVTRGHPARHSRPTPVVAPRPVAATHPVSHRRPPARLTTTPVHRTRPKPLVMVPTGGAIVCYVGQPCHIPSTAWHVTHACTAAWRAATHQPCPPGYPALP